MPDKSEQKEEKELQKFHVEQRRALNNAYGALVGSSTNTTFQAYTFEEAVDQLIETIEGEGTQLRPNLLGRVDMIENNVKKAVEELKQVPPEKFIEADDESDVNTEETPPE